MTAFEKLEAKVELMQRRIHATEQLIGAVLARDADDQAAQKVAQEHGFAVSVLVLPATASAAGNVEKKQLAKMLKAKLGWNSRRIARVLRVAERTILRWGGKVPRANAPDGAEGKA